MSDLAEKGAEPVCTCTPDICFDIPEDHEPMDICVPCHYRSPWSDCLARGYGIQP